MLIKCVFIVESVESCHGHYGHCATTWAALGLQNLFQVVVVVAAGTAAGTTVAAAVRIWLAGVRLVVAAVAVVAAVELDREQTKPWMQVDPGMILAVLERMEVARWYSLDLVVGKWVVGFLRLESNHTLHRADFQWMRVVVAREMHRCPMHQRVAT